MANIDMEQLKRKIEAIEKDPEDNNKESLEENGRKIMENEQNLHYKECKNEKGVVKTILLSKKIKLGRRKFDKKELMIDTITNAYILIKGWMKSGAISGVQDHRNNKLIKKELKEINYKGTIDISKKILNIRILSINPNGFNIDYNEKINQLIKYCEEQSIDIVLMSETNSK